jgi:ThiF family protein
VLCIKPRFIERLSAGANRTQLQLESLGAAEAAAIKASVVVTLAADASWSRRLCGATLVDYLVRLEPLVGTVYLDSSCADDLVGDLATRFPVEIGDQPSPSDPDVIVSIGAPTRPSTLIVDGLGWVSAVGEVLEMADDRNPVGPMAAAAIGAGEILKLLFVRNLSSLSFTKRLVLQAGAFSFFSYEYGYTSPPIDDVALDAILVGAGGVGSGLLATIAAMGPRIAGRLCLVDDDFLAMDNLNRVLYAPLHSAIGAESKVAVAKQYLRRRTPMLDVQTFAESYQTFSRRIPRRFNRRYPVIVTAVDDDEVRWEVQRDLPHELIDGATGRHGNLRVERVVFGEQGCIGCSHPPGFGQVLEGEECDMAPDPMAPSISFLSGLTGTLAAAELLKLAQGSPRRLAGFFEYVFVYPLNPDQQGRPEFHSNCQVGCRQPAVLEAYKAKWREQI